MIQRVAINTHIVVIIDYIHAANTEEIADKSAEHVLKLILYYVWEFG